MQQFEVERCGGVCAATGVPLEENQEIHAVLFEDGDSFRRADYSLDGWSGPPEGAYCVFRTRVPVKEKKKRLLVDDDVLVNFFLRLADESDESRVHFRFVLALILMRKRILKYIDSVRTEDGEVWRMKLGREDDEHRVVNPQLTEDQIENVSRELTAILHGDVRRFDELSGDDVDDRSADDDRDVESKQSSQTDTASLQPEASDE